MIRPPAMIARNMRSISINKERAPAFPANSSTYWIQVALTCESPAPCTPFMESGRKRAAVNIRDPRSWESKGSVRWGGDVMNSAFVPMAQFHGHSLPRGVRLLLGRPFKRRVPYGLTQLPDAAKPSAGSPTEHWLSCSVSLQCFAHIRKKQIWSVTCSVCIAFAFDPPETTRVRNDIRKLTRNSFDAKCQNGNTRFLS
jgi:hypothetical protein